MKTFYTLTAVIIFICFTTICKAGTCSGAPPVATVTASPSSLCKGSGTSTLSLTGLIDTIGLTYQWYYSTVSGGGPWTVISVNGTNSTYIAGPNNVTTWYYCAVTCSGSTTNSAS